MKQIIQVIETSHKASLTFKYQNTFPEQLKGFLRPQLHVLGGGGTAESGRKVGRSSRQAGPTHNTQIRFRAVMSRKLPAAI
jgi:hypothetical protein